MSLFYTTCIVLAQIICLNVTESKFTSFNINATDQASLWKGRTKRELFDEVPSQLKITFRYVTGEEVEFSYTKTPQYLANKHLPIFTSEGNFLADVMNDIGEFVLYQDPSKCSAVVFFEQFQCLYGVIGMDHYIRDVPFDFGDDGIFRSGVIGEPYVKPTQRSADHIHPADVYPPPSDTDAWYDFLRPSNNNPDQSRKRPSDFDAGTSTKRQRTDEPDSDADGNRDSTTLESTQDPQFRHYYLETVVFVARDIAEVFENVFRRIGHIRWIVRHLIIHFNAIDMMFQNIEIPFAKIHINIAKIVIETELRPFDFMSNPRLEFMEVVRNSRQYLRSNARLFEPDSFDHVLIYSRRQIFDGVIQTNGFTKYGADLYEARKRNEFYEVVPITLIKFQKYYNDYVVIVHEIGRVLRMNVDPRENGLEPTGQCYGMMQREGPKCNNCLKWSDDSQSRLGVFLRENRNRCFLLNEPRSLRPPGPSTFLRAATQCECFGYDSHVKYSSGLVINLVGVRGCTKPLQCQIGFGAGSNHESTVVPFDGTPCASGKVCWKRKCLLNRSIRWPSLQHRC